MHSRWLKTRRHFYESLRQEILMITGPLSEDLVQYQNEYEKIFDRVWDVSSMDGLLNQMLSSKIILAGDYHYFYQSQRTHLRILRELKKQVKTSKDSGLCLHLEVFDFSDQKKLNQYLESKITFDELLRKTKWNKKWNQLPHKGYEILLEWAKTNQVLVLGVNDSSLENLSDRDRFSGSKINEAYNQNPHFIHYVIYGEFHLAETHLPFNIKAFDTQRDLILCLNSDKLYFALSEHAIEDQFDVLKLNHLYCVLSSTPWVKLQSYLIYLQEIDDQMISDVEDDEGFEPDYTDYLGKILETFRSDFDLPDWRNVLDVLTPNDVTFERLASLKLSKSDKEKLSYFITAQKNIVFSKHQMQFLAKPSVNSAYSLVGEFIHCQLSQRKDLIWSGEDFMRKRIWMEAVSFFFNLWLNPTVKSPNDPKSDVENWTGQLEASGYLGKIMGQKLYKKVKSGQMSHETLISYLSIPLESPKFEAMYSHLDSILINSNN